MRFFDRLSTLMKADAHGVLEQLEEKSLLSKQHLREAELELTRKRARCEALEEESRRATEEAARLEAEIASLDEDVELALAGEKEELARFSLRRLLPKRRVVSQLHRRIAEIGEERERMRERLESQEACLESLRRRVRTRLAACREADAGGCVAEVPAAEEEVELELMRRRRAETPR